MIEAHTGFWPSTFTNSMQPGEMVDLTTGDHTGAAYHDVVNGFSVYSIETPENAVDNSVFLVMPKIGNSVPPVEIVGDIRLSVKAVQGNGLLVVRFGGKNETRAIALSADAVGSEGPDVIELAKGDAYGYVNSDTEPFVIRDDCSPAFSPEDEVDATNPQLLAMLGRIAEEPANW